jgi:hypothetical protein
MVSEYSQEFETGIMKSLRSNHYYSEITYQGTVIIPHVKDIFEKFKHIRNPLNIRTI